MNNYTLYGLNRPGEEARYIGITGGTLKRRLVEHRKDHTGDYRGRWMAKAKRENAKIEIVPYCVGLSEKEACELEAAVIAELRKIGLDLVNTSPGGNLPPATKWTLEKKTALAVRMQGNKYSLGKNLGNKNGCGGKGNTFGRKWTPEQKAAKSAQMTGKTNAAHSAAMILAWEAGAVCQQKTKKNLGRKGKIRLC